jgi:signal peptidase
VIRKVFMNLAMVALFAIAGVMLVPAALGYHRYIILTGSMTGTYDPGSLVFDRPVPTTSLKVGDPITYAPPPGASPNHKLVTHRIYKIFRGPNGRPAYITKGDANPAPDVWKFQLAQPTQDKVMFHIPYVGYIFEFLSVRQFRTALIGVPALLMALWMIFGMWRDGGAVVRRRREGVKPWGPDVAKRLPVLSPIAEIAMAAARATVRVPVTWPAVDDERARVRRTRAQAAFKSPFAKPRVKHAGSTGVVALPAPCVARARRATQRRRDRLPKNWQLVVNPRL